MTDKSTKPELLEHLKMLAKDTNYSQSHSAAVEALIQYIDDEEILNAYSKVGQWHGRTIGEFVLGVIFGFGIALTLLLPVIYWLIEGAPM